MNNELFNAIFEAAIDGDITEYQRDAMLDIITTEGVFSNPIKKFKEKIDEIKKGRVDEYSDMIEVKNFIDRNQKTLDEVAEILEKEPKELSKNAIKTLIGSISTILAGIALSIMFPAAGITATMIGYAGWIVTTIINVIRATSDRSAYTDLIKIRTSLKKTLNIKGITPDYHKKIKKIISQIDDVETEFRSGTNNVNAKITESVTFDDLFNEMADYI